MCNKGFLPRFLVLFAGAFFNFVFAFIILFVSALIWGAVSMKPYIGDVTEGYPAYDVGLESGDLVLSLNGKKISNWDKGLVMLQTTNGEAVVFEVMKSDGSIQKYTVEPKLEKAEDDHIEPVEQGRRVKPAETTTTGAARRTGGYKVINTTAQETAE